MKCDYCKGKFIEDTRGNCSACGGPEPEQTEDTSIRLVSVGGISRDYSVCNSTRKLVFYSTEQLDNK